MGLIKAGMGALGGTLADQWKEFFYCDSLDKDMKRYLELNPEKVGELTGEFKAEGREHCR